MQKQFTVHQFQHIDAFITRLESVLHMRFKNTEEKHLQARASDKKQHEQQEMHRCFSDFSSFPQLSPEAVLLRDHNAMT